MSFTNTSSTSLSTLTTDFDDLLMDNLDQASIYRLSWTSREFNDRVNAYMRRRLSIEMLLGRFLTECEWGPFRLLQRQYGVVISGSAALHFISRARGWEPNDLDTYVEHDYALPLILWLLEIGFRYRPAESRPELTTIELALDNKDDEWNRTGYHTPGSILDMVRNDQKIQVIAVRGAIMDTIINFHTSAVMNVITHDTAYCLYPFPTLTRNLSVLQNGSAALRMRNAAIKYHKRGWEIGIVFPIASKRITLRTGSDSTTENTLSVIPTPFQQLTIRLKRILKISYDIDGSDGTVSKVEVKVRRLGRPTHIFKEGIRRVGDDQCWRYKLPELDADIVSPSRLIEANTWLSIYSRNHLLHIQSYTKVEAGIAYAYAYATKELMRDVEFICGNTLWKRTLKARDEDVLMAVVKVLGGGGGKIYVEKFHQGVREDRYSLYDFME